MYVSRGQQNKYFGYQTEENELEELLNLTNNYSGSDIESVLRDLAYDSIAENKEITTQDIINAFKKSVSMYNTNKEKIEKIKNWAKDRTINASLPEEVQTTFNKINLDA